MPKMKKCIIVKLTDEEGDEIFLVNTHGYGPAWSSQKEDAQVFESKISANDFIDEKQLHNARTEELK